jgi:hypothetical protein
VQPGDAVRFGSAELEWPGERDSST